MLKIQIHKFSLCNIHRIRSQTVTTSHHYYILHVFNKNRLRSSNICSHLTCSLKPEIFRSYMFKC
jgi:hypothetical protein